MAAFVLNWTVKMKIEKLRSKVCVIYQARKYFYYCGRYRGSVKGYESCCMAL
jgi:hypothetical protein